VARPLRANTRRYVLDANALIGLFEDRKVAAEKVEHLLREALRSGLPLLMSAINWGEVFYMEWRCNGEAKAREAEARMEEMPIMIVAVDRARSSRAGALKQKHGLAYADAFAAELAIEHGAWLVTADPEFAKVGQALSIYSLPRYER
jgi:predicted nucleic acid-binding protein